MPGPFETKRVLIVVRTYPTPARKGIEVSCTAAVTQDQKWMRLFPVPYRFMDKDHRFTKYQWIDVRVAKASDARVESYTPSIDTIQIVSEVNTDRQWRERRRILGPLMSRSLCHLQRERDANGSPTLGLFRPKRIKRLLIRPDSPTWTPEQQTILRQDQMSLFGQNAPNTMLEKVPFDFRYEFECDDPQCTGHDLTCTDWEMGAAWRSWRRYGGQWEEKFRLRFEEEMIEKNDTHFYVGTVHRFPASWIIVGLFYPPRERPGAAPLLPGLN
jgi:hypothetical protein